MLIIKNQIIRWLIDGEGKREFRVLFIEKPHIIVIEITGKVLPLWWKYDELHRALELSEAEFLGVDPYASLLSPPQEYLETHRLRRDQAWEVIAPIVDSGIKAFIPAERQRLIEIAASIERPWRQPSRKNGTRTVSEVTIRANLLAYWQRGQNKN